MKKLILFLLILAISVFIYFVFFNQQSKPEIIPPTLVEKKEEIFLPTSNPSPTSEIYQCSVDDDCTLVSVSKCCGFVAVNKNFKDEIKSTPMICTAVCYLEAECNKGACEVIKTK